MDRQTLQKLQELLSKNESIAIAVGKTPSVDDMGAALALYLSLQAAGKNVSVASPVTPLVEVSNLVGIDKVSTSLIGSGGDMIVSFPYNNQEEIKKVKYTLEGNYLNIIVEASEQGLSFSEKDVKFIRGGGAPSLLFIVATPKLADLGSFFNPETLKETTIVNIDNKQHNQGFGDVVLVSSEFSSVSEQMANMLVSLDLPIDQDTAQNLFSGILQATDNFQKPRTSYVALEMAGILMRKGAKRVPMQPSVQPQQYQPHEQPRQPHVQSQLQQQPRQQSHGQQPPRQQHEQPQQRPQHVQSSPHEQPRQVQSGFVRQPGIQQPHQPSQSLQAHPVVQPQGSQSIDDFSEPFFAAPTPQQQSGEAGSGSARQSQPVSSFAQPQRQPPAVSQSQPRAEEPKQDDKGKNPPPDWLMPKVYRGSTNI